MDAIRSPIIYAGSKYRYWNTISRELPETINKALDVFCGSGEVGINLPSNQTIMNDACRELIGIHQYFQNNQHTDLVHELLAESMSFGLRKHEQEDDQLLKLNFESMKEEYNRKRTPELLYILSCHSFSNQIRFNRKGDFNSPYGKRWFNKSLQGKLKKWLGKLSETDITFTSKDFSDFDFNEFDFVFCDPPYLNTSSSYMEVGKLSWGIPEEYKLYDKLEKTKSKFMLTNQLVSKGKTNDILMEWIKDNDYRITPLTDTCKNCNYQRNNDVTNEVIVTNY